MSPNERTLAVSATATEVAQRPEVEAFVEAFAEGWRAPNDLERMVAHFTPMLTPDVRLVQPQIPTLIGREQFRTGFAEPLFALMPDLHGEVEAWAARGDVVFIQVVLRGTLAGRPASFRSCDRITLREGLIAERVAFMDPAPLVKAIVSRPRAWPAFARSQLTNLRLRFGRQA
jgi:ketosteroid isomerase-like protein